MFDQLLKYDLGKGVEAFSTQRDAVLPYEVTQGHQVHGSRVAIIDRAGMTREELEGSDALSRIFPASPSVFAQPIASLYSSTIR